MRSYFSFHRKISKSSGLILICSIFTIIGLAGSLSGCDRKTPSPSATAAPTKLPTVALPSPTPTPMDLPLLWWKQTPSRGADNP